MEDLIIKILESGNITAILSAGVCYLIINLQRKSTKETRDSRSEELEEKIDSKIAIANVKLDVVEQEIKLRQDKIQEEMQMKISNLNTDSLLLKKDVNSLKEENIGIKQDVKEIKTTLNQMAISLATIASATNSKVKEK